MNKRSQYEQTRERYLSKYKKVSLAIQSQKDPFTFLDLCHRLKDAGICCDFEFIGNVLNELYDLQIVRYEHLGGEHIIENYAFVVH